LYGGFVPPQATNVRRHNPDKDPAEKPKQRRQQSSANVAWFVEFNRQRHLKLGAENKERVYAALLENPGLNCRALAQVMRCSVTMANTHLRNLVAEGRAYKAKRNMPRGGMEILYFAVTK
jgi:hypothetical protein